MLTKTAPRFGVRNNIEKIVKVLVAYGASLALRDKRGNTPGDYALKSLRTDIAGIFARQEWAKILFEQERVYKERLRRAGKERK